MPITINGNGAISGLGDIDGHDLETATLVVSGDTTIAPQAVGRATLFVDESTNRVGINTTTPTRLVQVSDVNPLISVTETGSSKEVLLGANASAGFVGTETSHDFRLITNGVDRVAVDNTGLVGIGTTSPSTKLNVKYGNLESTSLHELILNADYGTSNNNGGRIGVTFSGHPDGTPGAGSKTAGIYGVSTDSTQYTRSMGLVFNTSTTDTASAEVVRIDSLGRLGVNTNDPTTPLHVAPLGNDADNNLVAKFQTRQNSVNTSTEIQMINSSSATSIHGFGFRQTRTGAISTQFDIFQYNGAATQVGVMAIESDGRIVLNSRCPGIAFDGNDTSGADVSSKTLDDYEEGVWTPDIRNQNGQIVTSGLTTEGIYVKIGDLLYLSARIEITDSGGKGYNDSSITWSAGPSASANLLIGNVPFTLSENFAEIFTFGYGINASSRTAMFGSTVITGARQSTSTSLTFFKQASGSTVPGSSLFMTTGDWVGNKICFATTLKIGR